MRKSGRTSISLMPATRDRIYAYRLVTGESFDSILTRLLEDLARRGVVPAPAQEAEASA